MEKSVNLRSMGARQGSRFKLGGMKSRVKTKVKNKGGDGGETLLRRV